MYSSAFKFILTRCPCHFEFGAECIYCICSPSLNIAISFPFKKFAAGVPV
jgi:hypothetical protein